MFLAHRFNSFDLVTATTFSKSSVMLLITPFTAFSLRNFDMYKIISPKNLKDQTQDYWDYIEKF